MPDNVRDIRRDPTHTIVDNVEKNCLACASLVVTAAEQTPLCARCRGQGLRTSQDLVTALAAVEMMREAGAKDAAAREVCADFEPVEWHDHIREMDPPTRGQTVGALFTAIIEEEDTKSVYVDIGFGWAPEGAKAVVDRIWRFLNTAEGRGETR